MPEYSHYSSEKNPMPIFAECFIDNISNLKEGDYLVNQKHWQEDGPTPVSGMTTIWNITRVTKKCVYIEHPHYGGVFKQIRLCWKDIGETNPHSLYKGYLNNDSWNYTFYRYVKKDDMNLDHFYPSDQLIR